VLVVFHSIKRESIAGADLAVYEPHAPVALSNDVSRLPFGTLSHPVDPESSAFQHLGEFFFKDIACCFVITN
jgi:hypothetical protein